MYLSSTPGRAIAYICLLASAQAAHLPVLYCTTLLCTRSPFDSSPFPFRDHPTRDVNFNFNIQKVRAVNLGGWLVLEPWITPSLFQPWARSQEVKDEYTFSQVLGHDEAFRRLNAHWKSWITRDDFFQIARAGLNHVRIPIGYWAVRPLPGEPYVQGQLGYLDQAIGWARDAGVRIMIDLHGAPGSQNGFDNSGRLGPVNWQLGDTVAQTIDAIAALAARYSGATDTVTSIELLNEPFPYNPNPNFLANVKPFYESGYGTVRSYNPDTLVVIHDAFQGLGYWQGYMGPQTSYSHVMLDLHLYQVFTEDQIKLNPSEHIAGACSAGRDLSTADKWTVVGEWTGAQTDCAKWLNGLGKGARYDGSLPGYGYHGSCNGKTAGTVADLPNVDKYNLRQFIEAQLDAYERRTGWIFWTWKTESAPEWDMQDLLANGLFPQPLTARQYPNQCRY